MQIHIEHNDTTINSLLKTLADLTLPLDIVNEIIHVLKEALVECAADAGNNACDIIENINSMDAIRKSVTDHADKYEHMCDILRCLQYMEEYRKAASAAGVK